MAYNKKIIYTLLTGFLLLAPTIVLASTDLNSMLNDAAGNAGYNTANTQGTQLAIVAGLIARVFISLIGLIFIAYTIYGGFLWMMAAGNEEQVKKAKNIIRDGIIGIIVILAAAAIYTFISNVLISGTIPGSGQSGSS